MTQRFRYKTVSKLHQYSLTDSNHTVVSDLHLQHSPSPPATQPTPPPAPATQRLPPATQPPPTPCATAQIKKLHHSNQSTTTKSLLHKSNHQFQVTTLLRSGGEIGKD